MTPEGYDSAGAVAEYGDLWREWGLELSPGWRGALGRVSMAEATNAFTELRVAFLHEGALGAEETQLLHKIVQAMGLSLGREAGVFPVADDWRGSVPGSPAFAVVLGPSLWSVVSGRSEFEADRGKFHPSDRPGLQWLPTWPPSHLLRQPEAKRIVWEDMKVVLRGLAESRC